MHWPFTPVHRLQAFRPPFCPHAGCPAHRLRSSRSFRFRRHGFYSTSRCRRVPRFVCLHCRRSFSRQAFSTRYFLKRPELLVPIAAALLAGSAHRQIARSLGCSPSTVTRLSARLGRHALLLLARALSELHLRLDEPVVVDHFETFEFSQDLPFGIATAVGHRSWFLYALDPAPHRSSLSRSRPPRPHRSTRGGYLGSTSRSSLSLTPLRPSNRRLHLIGDGHLAYDRAVRSHRLRSSILLERHPNPPRGPKGSPRSARAIARDRAMFPADALHSLLRHSLAHHRRETIAFGRRLNALMERMFLTAAWRNFIKGRSERRPDPTTPAMRLGLTTRPWSWPAVLSRRLFPGREKLPPAWAQLYRREWTTPALAHNTRHRLRYAG